MSDYLKVLHRATNEVEYAEWLEALRNGIASQLANGCESPTDSKKGMASRALAQELWVVNGNSKCADCGQKDPEWAVLNLGILICVKCSGIHRSLGVHISKVRSLELDKWEPQQLGVRLHPSRKVMAKLTSIMHYS